jgi:pimeloyl-ACP methyl ester carboxylesterase
LRGTAAAAVPTLDDQANVMEQAILDQIERSDVSSNRVHLLGHSYGGSIALCLMRRILRPQKEPRLRIASITLYEPNSLFFNHPDERALMDREINDKWFGALHQEPRDMDAFMAHFMCFWFGAGSWEKLPDKQKEAMKMSMRDVDLEIAATMNEVARPDVDRHWQGVFQTLRGATADGNAGTSPTIPMNVFLGERGTSEIIHSMAGRLASLHGFSRRGIGRELWGDNNNPQYPHPGGNQPGGLGHMAPVTHAQLVLPVLARAGGFGHTDLSK